MTGETPRVREFCETTTKTGKWNGAAVEGFVVRTTIGPRPADKGDDTRPYPPGRASSSRSNPMSHRNWREIEAEGWLRCI